MSLHGEDDCLGDEKHHHDRAPPAGDLLEALDPGLVVPTYRLEHRPETVVEVEPEGDEADDVDNRGVDLRECLLEEECARCGGEHVVNATDLLELHLSPELDEMHHEEGEDDDAEHEHVLTRPFHGLRTA